MLDSDINCYSLCYHLLKPKISWALSKLMIDHGYIENFMQSGRALGQGGTAVGATSLGSQHEGPLICPLYYTGLDDKNRDTTRPWLLGRRREAN
jgi:hypothetical protein